MGEWVWSNGGMILTGENWSAGRKTLYSVGGRWMNEYGAMVEWYWQGKTEVLGEIPFPSLLFPPYGTRNVQASNRDLHSMMPAPNPQAISIINHFAKPIIAAPNYTWKPIMLYYCYSIHSALWTGRTTAFSMTLLCWKHWHFRSQIKTPSERRELWVLSIALFSSIYPVVIRTKRYELYSGTVLQIIHKKVRVGKTQVVAGECEGEHEMGVASAREWRVMFQGER